MPGVVFRDLALNPLDRTVTRNGTMIELTAKEYALLDYLVQHAGAMVTEKELIEEVWGLSFNPQTNIINVYLHHLRNKIDKESDANLIHTVRGQGYVFGDKP